MSNKNDGQQQILSEMVEKILFNEKELEILRELINKVGRGSTDPKQLRTAIIENREIIKNKILNLFPFYHKQISYQRQIDNFAERDVSLEKIKELEEKNELLRKVGEWMVSTRKTLEEESNI